MQNEAFLNSSHGLLEFWMIIKMDYPTSSNEQSKIEQAERIFYHFYTIFGLVSLSYWLH